jgi:hypothetical protein
MIKFTQKLKKMLIFSYLNISNPSNIEADSGFIFQKLLLRSILKTNQNFRAYFICPKNTPPIHKRVKNIQILKNRCNKYSVRFNFPWFNYLKLPFLKDIDIAIINQPELTSNFKALFTVLGNKKVKVISYFHYLPIEKLPVKNRVFWEQTMNHRNLAKIIFKRQIESLTSADYCITCSRFAIRFLKENGKALGEKINFKKIIHIPPPISLEETLENKTEERFPIKTIVYNHRLYRHYGTIEIFNWLSELFKKRQDFQVLLTDPTYKRSKDRNILNPDVEKFKKYLGKLPFVRIRHIKRHANYYKTIWKSHLGLAPLKPSALWSMATVDLMACAKPVLAPNYACFPEMLKNRTSLLFKNKEEFLNKINFLLDNSQRYYQEANYCFNLVNDYSEKVVAQKFIKVFNYLLNE